MRNVIDRAEKRIKTRRRIRARVVGTALRPRLSVFRSLKHIYVQAVDDGQGKTLAQASTRDPEVRGKGANGGNIAAAKAVGVKIAERLLAQGCDRAVFDRSGFIYHGRIKALAEAAREKGLKF